LLTYPLSFHHLPHSAALFCTHKNLVSVTVEDADTEEGDDTDDEDAAETAAEDANIAPSSDSDTHSRADLDTDADTDEEPGSDPGYKSYWDTSIPEPAPKKKPS
jgi:hypothetical protein